MNYINVFEIFFIEIFNKKLKKLSNDFIQHT